MKPWIKKTLFSFLGAGMALGGLSACSGGHHRHGAGLDGDGMAQMRGKVMERVSGRLHLDEVQKQKLNVLADKLEAQRSAMVGNAGGSRAQMQALVAGEKFDREGAHALLKDKTQAVQTHGPEVIHALADFYDALNPAQQQQMRDLMQRRKGWMAQG